MGLTAIEWATHTWNPVVGCSRVSEGCRNCYAEKMAHRLAAMARKDQAAGRNAGAKAAYLPVVNEHGKWSHKTNEVDEVLDYPLHLCGPARIFVGSMGDLFHESVGFDVITRIFDVMCSWRWPSKRAERTGDLGLLVDPGHTYMVLTKRPERIQPWRNWVYQNWRGDSPFNLALDAHDGCIPPHIYMGTSCEDQAAYDARMRHLFQIDAYTRFVSCEPLLGDINLGLFGTLPKSIAPNYTLAYQRVNWVICGGESGGGARPMHPDWARSLRDQCQAAGVPFFFKQWGEWAPNCLCERKRPHRTIERPGPGKPGVMFRCGKERAGHLLDGREWAEFPPAAESKSA